MLYLEGKNKQGRTMTAEEQFAELRKIQATISSTWLKNCLKLDIKHFDAHPDVNLSEYYCGELTTLPYVDELVWMTRWSIDPGIWRIMTLESKAWTLVKYAMKSPAAIDPVEEALRKERKDER